MQAAGDRQHSDVRAFLNALQGEYKQPPDSMIAVWIAIPLIVLLGVMVALGRAELQTLLIPIAIVVAAAVVAWFDPLRPVVPDQLVWVLPGRNRTLRLDAQQISGFDIASVKYGTLILVRVQGKQRGKQFRATREVKARAAYDRSRAAAACRSWLWLVKPELCVFVKSWPEDRPDPTRSREWAAIERLPGTRR